MVLSTFTYDGMGRLLSLSHDLTEIEDPTPEPEIVYGFGYDKANRLTSFTNSVAHPDEDATYQYDAKDQLTAVNHDDPNTDDETYDYDENGNREEANGDSYWQWSNNQIFFDGTFYYTYDDEGNLTMRQAEDESELDIYQYDHRNRLTKATIYTNSGTQVVRYTYDAFDRLVKRAEDPNWESEYGTIEYFVYDGSDPVLEFVDADGEGEAEPELSRRFLNGPAVDQILAEEELEVALSAANRVLWHLDDHQGTTRDLLDAVGDVIEHYRFDSYGNLLAIEDAEGDPISGDPSTRFLYTGLFRDPTTGLYLTQTRWYDPITGRWISEDWIEFYGGSWNLDEYVGNSPTNWSDPSGQSFGDLWNSYGWVVSPGAWIGQRAGQRFGPAIAADLKDRVGSEVEKATRPAPPPEPSGPPPIELPPPPPEAPKGERLIALSPPDERMREFAPQLEEDCYNAAELGADVVGSGLYSEIKIGTGRTITGQHLSDEQRGNEALLTFGVPILGAIIGRLSKLGRGAASHADEAEECVEDAAKASKGEYRDVGGHHVHIQSGFKGHLSYDPRTGFSISQEYMKSRGWSHQSMTNKQRELFGELARSGSPNTLAEHSRIAQEALIAGGATRAEAQALVQESLEQLTQQGLTAPSHIPWQR